MGEIYLFASALFLFGTIYRLPSLPFIFAITSMAMVIIVHSFRLEKNNNLKKPP